jgi:hypothetical protein
MNDYPRYPGANCVAVSRYLAARYLELELRVGVLRWTYRGLRLAVPHAWCVGPDGQIVDATWQPRANTTEVEYVASAALTALCQ